MKTSVAPPPRGQGRRSRGLRRALGLGVALAALGGLAASSAGGAQIFPANGGFDTGPQGWHPTSTCQALLLPGVICRVDQDWRGDLGAPPGSIITTYRVLLDALGLLTVGEGTWRSPEFVFRGQSFAAALRFDRAAQIEPLLNLGGTAFHNVVLRNLTTGGETLLREEQIGEATQTFQTIAFVIPPDLFQDNNVYVLEFRMRFEARVLGLLGGQSILHDNVQLAVDDDGTGLPPGFPTGTGGLPPFGQVLPQDVCVMPERRVRQRTQRTPTPGAVRLSREQLTINQRISQAAVRRVNSVLDKFAEGFTAADFRDCSIRIQDFEPPLQAQIRAGQPGEPPPVAGRAGTAPRRTPSARGQIRLSREQLLINQRISQAAVRRVNAVLERFRTGLLGGDIRGNTLTRLQMEGALRTALRRGTPPGTGPAAHVPLNIRARTGGNPQRVTLSRQQLLINQRISQAAVRRINSVQDQLAIGLTGANIQDGELRRANLADALQLPNPN